MGRSPDGSRSRLFFKFQSSENIDAITNAFPEVPWVFLFREPVEVTSTCNFNFELHAVFCDCSA
jgi:hypothetical protein